MKENFQKIHRQAESGDIDAQYALAVRLAVGDRVHRDLLAARYWYLQAANLGHADAAYNLAAMYLSGEGGAKSKRNAVSWFKKASLLGSSDASIWLAETALSESKDQFAAKYFTISILQKDMRGLRGLAVLLAKSNGDSAKAVASIISTELEQAGMNLS